MQNTWNNSSQSLCERAFLEIIGIQNDALEPFRYTVADPVAG